MVGRICKKANVEQALEALVDPMIDKWMKERGFVRGDFDGQRNLADVIRDTEYRQQLDEALRGAAQADRRGYERLMQGFANLTGTEWTPELASKARTLSGDFAQIAPYLYRVAPDLFDEFHGSEGSVASLTHAIAESGRGRVDPRMAGQKAEAIFKHIYDGNPATSRGFSAQQLGQIYQEMARRGVISPNATAPEASRQLERYIGPLSAVRDTLGNQGWPVGVGDMFQTLDQLAPGQFAQLSPQELETQLRTGDALGRMGGLYSAASKYTPPSMANTPQPQLAAQDAQLRQQASQSSLGNLAAATARINKLTPVAAGSPAATMWSAFQRGEAPVTEPGEWLDIMEQSGIPRNEASAILSQQAVNMEEMTPELIDTIRRNQYQADIQPAMAQVAQAVPQNSPYTSTLQQGAREQLARSMGYQGYDHLQQLHQPAQHTRGIMDQARQQAGIDQQVSHIGQQSPFRRTVDAIQTATPQTSLGEIGQKAMNFVPYNQFPKNVQQHYPDLFKQGESGGSVQDGEKRGQVDQRRADETFADTWARWHADDDPGATAEGIHAGVLRVGRDRNGITKSAAIGGMPVTIDRPRGFKKKFWTQQGKVEKEYPVDYGYFDGIINPDDNEELDVFVGTGGPHYGRFMKGTDLKGYWEPDERKWYAGLTDTELDAVKNLFLSQHPDLLQDYHSFADEASFLDDVRSSSAHNLPTKSAGSDSIAARSSGVSSGSEAMSGSGANNASSSSNSPRQANTITKSSSSSSIWPLLEVVAPVTTSCEWAYRRVKNVKLAEDRQKTVAVDLDGTLAEMYDDFDPKKIEPPRPGAKAMMDKFRDEGCRIIIFTVRGTTRLVADWCEKHDIPYDFINENPDQPEDGSGKVIADVYVDDRAVDARDSLENVTARALKVLRAA